MLLFGVAPVSAVHPKLGPPKTPQAPMGTVQVAAPVERVAIMGPLNETEHHSKYVLVVQDYFTKWVEAFPMTRL